MGCVLMVSTVIQIVECDHLLNQCVSSVGFIASQKSPLEHGSVVAVWKSFHVQELVMSLETDILTSFLEGA